MQATNSSLRSLIEGTKVFAVPLYQRRYTWERKNWVLFWESILEQYEFTLLEDGQSAQITHFIGSIVLAPAPGAASEPTKFILVDGQQRLTTTMLALAALRDLLAEDADDEEARQAVVAKYNTLYLHNAFEKSETKRLRLLPTQQDREEYFAAVGRTPADPQGRMGECYDYFRSSKAMRGTDLRGDPLELERVSEILLGRLTLVEITTQLGDNVNRIFQTLNSAGVKLKQVDLLRNHFFMLLPSRAEELYAELWRDMELALGERHLDRFFWAELVRGDARVSRTDVYSAMQRRLQPIESSELAVEEFLRQLHADSALYRRILSPGEVANPVLRDRLQFLREWGSETANPLVLEILAREQDGRLSVQDAAACLLLIQSFMIRRMIVGIPTNNLNRIFTSLTPPLAKSELTPQTLGDALAQGQKYWPSDGQVLESIASRPFYFSGKPQQRRLLLESVSAKYDGKEVSDPTGEYSLEHIMPQVLTDEWRSALVASGDDPDRVHDRLLHTLGNVTLSGYNSELGNRSFGEKREFYASSGFAINRKIADEYQVWNANSIEERGRQLGSVIIALWPGPSSSEIDLSQLSLSAIEDALLLLPAGGYTTIADLMEISGARESVVSAALENLGDSIRDRVHSAAESKSGLYFDAAGVAALMADTAEDDG